VHTPHGTSIEVSTRVDNGQFIITVADNGPGISKADINKIFDKFYRAEGTSTGGTGLGLPIAKGFVEAHKGNLSVRNRVSGGTEFKIEIPIEGEAENR
jgi:two-component system sensor histidine kinase KdpD